MKIRELTRRVGNDTISAWPPRWEGRFRQGDTWDTIATLGDGVLASVRPLENTSAHLRLTMIFEGREYIGIVRWDPPPPPAAVESVLRANLGRETRAIGDLDIEA